MLLDYDGTLVPFAAEPRLAQPDAELLELLTALGSDPANEVAIVSGRPRHTLEDWFGQLPISLIAEHGVWLRNENADWRMLKTMTNDWKERVRPILQLFVDRLPGALLEEKEFSLAWHYRRADPDQASLRAKELLDDLTGYTRNIDVQVFEGNKVIEVRNSGINKGTAALEWLAGQTPDFILGIGDDWTDEDLFRALPPTAFSVRVGVANTAARYYLGNHTAVRRMLRELARKSRARKPTKSAWQPDNSMSTPKHAREGLGREPFWYKSGVIYEVHVRAFYDAERRWHGRLSRADGKTGLHQGPRRDRDLAAAVLSFTAQG